MNIKKDILEVLKEYDRATSKEIADKYLLQPRDKIDFFLKELEKENRIAYHNNNWYLIENLLIRLKNENDLLRKRIDKLIYRIANEPKKKDDLLWW